MIYMIIFLNSTILLKIYKKIIIKIILTIYFQNIHKVYIHIINYDHLINYNMLKVIS